MMSTPCISEPSVSNTHKSSMHCRSSAVQNRQMEMRSTGSSDRAMYSQVLLDLARIVCEEQSRLGNLAHKIMKHAQSLLQCQRCQILLLADDAKAVFSQVFESEVPSTQSSSNSRHKCECKPLNSDVTGFVSTTGQTVNIMDANMDDRFECSSEDSVDFVTKSLLCVPIRSADHSRVIGVFQLINKQDDSYFTKNDEQIFEAFAIFCGIGIENTLMHDKVVQAQARQSVALEVLSYHAVASQSDVDELKRRRIPSCHSLNLLDFTFDDLPLDDMKTVKACVRMFTELDVIEKFHINYEVLCRWLLSVKKNYRDVMYHNWRHAFNVAQYMFATLKTGQMLSVIDDLESMCLVVACLCHDLDHRGTNNQFQLKTASPLSRLYSTSVMEHHHFDQCIMLLNTKGNQIFANLDQESYDKAIKTIEHAILATDLALYFKNRNTFCSLVENDSVDWSEPTNRSLLFAMLMTAADVSSITKPWNIQQRVAALVASEFFEQGDLERSQLNEQPIAMMDRSKAGEVPRLQVEFIDSICLPLYKSLASISTHLTPMLKGCLQNRKNWSDLAERRLAESKTSAS